MTDINNEAVVSHLAGEQGYPTRKIRDGRPLDISATFAVHPDVVINTRLYQGDSLVALIVGNDEVTIDFHDVSDLWRLRGAVDELIAMLTGQITFLNSVDPTEPPETSTEPPEEP